MHFTQVKIDGPVIFMGPLRAQNLLWARFNGPVMGPLYQARNEPIKITGSNEPVTGFQGITGSLKWVYRDIWWPFFTLFLL